MIFKVLIQPRSSKNMISGLHDGALKIKLTAAPVDGAANKMCIQYLAKCFKVSKSLIEIISGHKSRTKLILFRNKGSEAAVKEKERLKQSIEPLIIRKS